MQFCPKCGSELTPSVIADRERLGCASPSCGFVFWNNPTPVVAAIVEHGENVILVRSKGWPAGMFGLVTGFLEAGETPEEGVLREVEEELGLEGEVASIVGFYSFFEMNQLILAFHVTARGAVVLGDELEEIKRVPTDKLRPWPFGTGDAVRDWLETR